MPADFTYPVGATRPTDLWVPYVVPADERIRNPQSGEHLSPDDRAAETGRFSSAGPGADGPGCRGTREGPSGVEQGLTDRCASASRSHRRRQHEILDADAAWGGRDRAADRVRERREPAPRARQRARARGRHPRGARRQPMAARSSAHGREPRAVDCRYGARHGPRVVGGAGPEERDARGRAARQPDRDRPARAGCGRGPCARDRASLRRRSGAAAVEAGPGERVEGGRARQRRRPASAHAQRAGRHRSGAGGRPARRRGALHRQLHHAHAHRPGLQSGERADGAGVAAVRTGQAARRFVTSFHRRSSSASARPRAWSTRR